jgi:hypothetical protein
MGSDCVDTLIQSAYKRGMSDIETMRQFSAILLVCVAIAVTIVLLVSRRASSGDRRLARFAERAGLPVPADGADALRARLRQSATYEAVGALVGIAAAGALLSTPIGISPVFPLAVFLPIVGLSIALSSTVVALRHSVFIPTTGTPRIARSHVVKPADYVDRVPRALVWVLSSMTLVAAGALVVAWIRVGVRWPEFALAAVAVAVIALALCAATPALDRAVLARPQAATMPLELAWDDAFRMATLNSIRRSGTILCVVALFLVGLTLWTNPDDPLGWTPALINLAMFVLSYVYPTTGAPLPRRLFPQGIHITAGSTA